MTTFQSLWCGEQLSLLARVCIRSFLDHGHAFELYTYQPIEAPTGTVLMQAADILPQDRVFSYGPEANKGAGSVAGFADLFRYSLLSQRGGWWVDTDVVCLSAQVPEATTFFGWEDADLLGNAILRFPKEDPLAHALFAKANSMGTNLRWGDTGPKLLTAMVVEHGLSALAQPQEYAYPLHWTNFEAVFRTEGRALVERLVGQAPYLHLWNEMFRRNPNLNLHCPEPGSFLHALYDKYASPPTS